MRELNGDSISLDDNTFADFFADSARATGDVFYVLQLEPNYGFEFMSASVVDHTGYAAEEILADPGVMASALDDRDAAQFAAALASPLDSDIRIELRWQSVTGDIIYTDHRARKRQRSDGAVVIEGSSRDISELRRAQQSAELARQRLQATLDSLLDPHGLLQAVRDSDGAIVDFHFIDANLAACAESGHTRAEFLDRSLITAWPGIVTSGLLARLAEVVNGGDPLVLDNMTYDHELPTDDVHFFDLRAVRVGDGVSITWRDVTDRQTITQQLAHRAAHDGLTGLLNRAALTDRLGKALKGNPRTGERLAVLFCDVDNLRAVNGQHGHLAGDALLKAVSGALMASVRSGDLVGRFGGDEFIVVLTGVHGLDDAERVAQGILEAAQTPYTYAGVRFTPSLSIGLTLAAPDQSIDDIIRDADRALYAAKASGRSRVTAFTPAVTSL